MQQHRDSDKVAHLPEISNETGLLNLLIISKDKSKTVRDQQTAGPFVLTWFVGSAEGNLQTDHDPETKTAGATSNWVGKTFYSIVAVASGAGCVFLVDQKLHADSFTVPWVVVIVVCFVSLVLVATSALTWWGGYFEGISVTRDAELVGVTRDGMARTKNDEPVFYWKFTCKWRENGRWLQATSPKFTGQLMFYHREKILVHVHPEKPERIHFVDVSFLSADDHGGMPIVTAKEMKEANRHFEEQMEKMRNSPIQRFLNSQGFTNQGSARVNLLYLLAGTIGAIALALILWWRLTAR